MLLSTCTSFSLKKYCLFVKLHQITSEYPPSSLEFGLPSLRAWDLVGNLGQEDTLRLQGQAVSNGICVKIVLQSEIEQARESREVAVASADADLDLAALMEVDFYFFLPGSAARGAPLGLV